MDPIFDSWQTRTALQGPSRASAGVLTLLLLYVASMVTGTSHISASPLPLASLAGIITERGTGELITGAVVSIRTDSTGSRPIRSGATNRYGFYSLGELPPGRYFISVHAAGFLALTDSTIFIAADGSTRLDLALEAYVSPEVVITGGRDEGTTTLTGVTELSPRLVRQLPAFAGEPDIFRALQLMPGVKASSEISSGLHVRGGSADQNLVLLDGVVIYNPFHLGGFLSTFNADAIRDIRLIKGAPPAEYGGRLSSVLDMTMREGTREKLSGSAGVSLLNSQLTVEGPIGDDATFMLSGRRTYADLLLLAIADSTTPDYYFYDLNGKVNLRLGENDRVYASAYFGRDVLEIPPNDKDAMQIDWGNMAANLRWTHIFSPTFFSSFSAVITDYSASTSLGRVDKETFESRSEIRDYMLRAEAEIYPSDAHIIKFGLESTLHRFDAAVSTLGSSSIERSAQRDALDASFYLQDEWEISTLLSTNVGARLYYFDAGEYLRVEPRFSIAFRATDLLTIRSAFAMGSQFIHQITRNDILLPTEVWLPSSATLRPAEGYQGVIGAGYTTDDDQWSISVESYYKRMENLLEYRDTTISSLEVPLEELFTTGSGEAYGIEFFLNRRIGDITGWIGYTLSWTERTFEHLNNGKPFPPRYDRRHDISVVATYRLSEDWSLAATWVYNTGAAFTMPTGQYAIRPVNGNGADDEYVTDRLRFSERNGYRLPAYHKLDLGATHSFSWFDLPWQLSLNLYNAYNQQNVFGQSISYNYTQDPATGEYRRTATLRRTTLFPIIPSVGLRFTW